MRVFIDTSAVLAVLDADDLNYFKAAKTWEKLLLSEDQIICHNYVLVEVLALLQNRFGMKAVRVFVNEVLPMIQVEWVDEMTHKAALSSMVTAASRKLSLVDCVSFEVMRQLGMDTAFTLDSDFAKQDFSCIP